MRKLLLLQILILFLANNSQAGFFDDKTRWSWSALKEKVKEKWQSFFKKEEPLGAAEITKKEMQVHYEKLKTVNVNTLAMTAVKPNDPLLIMGRNKIPVFEFKKLQERTIKEKIRKIPSLNVGSEDSILRLNSEEIKINKLTLINESSVTRYATPSLMTDSEFRQELGLPVEEAQRPQSLDIPVLKPNEKVTQEKINKLKYEIIFEEKFSELKIKFFAEEDLKLLRGLILASNKDQCHSASGIFYDLLNSPKEEISGASRYHLGVCLSEMNLPTEAVKYLSEVIRGKQADLIPSAVKSLIQNDNHYLEEPIGHVLANLSDSLILPENKSRVDYLKSKYYFKQASYQKALTSAMKVPLNTESYYKAQYVASLVEYQLGQAETSFNRQKEIVQELKKKGLHTELQALIQINIGRMAFQKAKFSESLEAFQKVPKEHPLWLQSLTELAWAQIQTKDAAGAIGNMHSIQSPYFDGVYKPESYVVRSIGYLNLCQYADAAKTLGFLEFKYTPWLEKMNVMNKNMSTAQLYEITIRHLATRKNADTDGVPFQVIREIARKKDFINLQEAINQIVDEQSGYPFIMKMIERDKSSLMSRRNSIINKIANLKQKTKSKKEISENEDLLAIYKFKIATLNEALEGMSKLQKAALQKLAAMKIGKKEEAGKVLKNHLSKLAKNLKKDFENNELIKYEVYAGSGENLRYQLAGGKTQGAVAKNRIPAGEKWNFDGEFWADEIGHYRSSLKNNCQKE